MDVVKEVRQTFLDINSSKFAAPHYRVNHGGILCRIVVLAEEIVLTRLCWQYNNVGIVRYVIVSQRIGLLVHNMKFGILRQVLKWDGSIYDRYTIPNQEKSGGAYERSTPNGARVVPFKETVGRKWPTLT